MKYVIFDQGGMDVAIIFPAFWDHADTVALHTNKGNVLSAGHLQLDALGNLYTTGKSQSLNVKSRPEDLDIITRHLKFVP